MVRHYGSVKGIVGQLKNILKELMMIKVLHLLYALVIMDSIHLES